MSTARFYTEECASKLEGSCGKGQLLGSVSPFGDDYYRRQGPITPNGDDQVYCDIAIRVKQEVAHPREAQ